MEFYMPFILFQEMKRSFSYTLCISQSPQKDVMVLTQHFILNLLHTKWRQKNISDAKSLPWLKGQEYLNSGLPWWHNSKACAWQCKSWSFDPWVWKIPLSEKWQPSILRGAWQDTVYRAAKNWTQLSTHTHTYQLYSHHKSKRNSSYFISK